MLTLNKKEINESKTILLTIIAVDIGAKTHMQMVMKRASATSSLFALKIQMKSLVPFFFFFFLWKYSTLCNTSNHWIGRRVSIE